MFVQLIIWVVLTIVQMLLRPKAKQQEVKPGTLGDKDYPMASESTPIPVVFGEVILTQPNVVWYGDIRTDPIKKTQGKK